MTNNTPITFITINHKIFSFSKKFSIMIVIDFDFLDKNKYSDKYLW